MLVADLRNPRQGIQPGWNSFTQLYMRLPDGGGNKSALRTIEPKRTHPAGTSRLTHAAISQAHAGQT
jgi:hypothetical protein